MASRRAPLPLEPFFEPVEAPVSETGRALYAYWQGLAEGDALPAREDIRMEELAALNCLDSVFILEPIDGGADWRYRLLGTQIVAMYGRDVTNVPFREHMVPDEAERAIALSNRVLETGEPLFLRARFVSGEYRPDIETMSLPIAARGGRGTWLFGGTFFS